MQQVTPTRLFAAPEYQKHAWKDTTTSLYCNETFMILHFWTIKSLHCLFFPNMIPCESSGTKRVQQAEGEVNVNFSLTSSEWHKNNNNSSSSNNRIFDRFALSIIEWGQSATPWRTGWYYSLSSECLLSFTLSCGCTQYFYRLVYLYQGAPSGGRKVKAICSSLNGHLGMSWLVWLHVAHVT